MSDFFRGLEGLHEGTVKMETGHLNLLEGGSERLDKHGSTSLERSDKKLEASMSSWLEDSTENADCSILEILEGEPSKTENAIWGALDGGLESLDGSLLDSFEGHIEKVDESVLGSLGNAQKPKMSAAGPSADAGGPAFACPALRSVCIRDTLRAKGEHLLKNDFPKSGRVRPLGQTRRGQAPWHSSAFSMFWART